ncbi:MAG: nucleotide exchange factor GrpE [Calditrichota bacterium]
MEKSQDQTNNNVEEPSVVSSEPRDGDFADDPAEAVTQSTPSTPPPASPKAESKPKAPRVEVKVVDEVIAETKAAENKAAETKAAETKAAQQKADIDVAAIIKPLEEQNLRLRAEFANYKKRIEREQIELAEYLKKNILMQILPILDDFKMMLEKSGSAESETSVIEGAGMIFENFQRILEKEGVQKINALGKTFDPLLHEAVMMKPVENDDDKDRVVEVFQEGFTLNEKLLRPSKVVIGRKDD